jgi:hypothetical protein
VPVSSAFGFNEGMVQSASRAGADNMKQLSKAFSSVSVFVLTAVAVTCCTEQARASPLTPFRYEGQAQRHCPADKVVWLDFRTGLYYLKRQKRYGWGFNGSLVCQKEARDSGYRRSLFGLR